MYQQITIKTATAIARALQRTLPFKERVDEIEEDVKVTRRGGSFLSLRVVGVRKLETHKIPLLDIAQEDMEILGELGSLIDDDDTSYFLSGILTSLEPKDVGFKKYVSSYVQKHTEPEMFICERRVVCFRQEKGFLIMMTEYLIRPRTKILSFKER
jgi:hypothetical protein